MYRINSFYKPKSNSSLNTKKKKTKETAAVVQEDDDDDDGNSSNSSSKSNNNNNNNNMSESSESLGKGKKFASGAIDAWTSDSESALEEKSRDDDDDDNNKNNSDDGGSNSSETEQLPAWKRKLSKPPPPPPPPEPKKVFQKPTPTGKLKSAYLEKVVNTETQQPTPKPAWMKKLVSKGKPPTPRYKVKTTEAVVVEAEDEKKQESSPPPKKTPSSNDSLSVTDDDILAAFNMSSKSSNLQHQNNNNSVVSEFSSLNDSTKIAAPPPPPPLPSKQVVPPHVPPPPPPLPGKKSVRNLYSEAIHNKSNHNNNNNSAPTPAPPKPPTPPPAEVVPTPPKPPTPPPPSPPPPPAQAPTPPTPQPPPAKTPTTTTTITNQQPTATRKVALGDHLENNNNINDSSHRSVASGSSASLSDTLKRYQQLKKTIPASVVAKSSPKRLQQQQQQQPTYKLPFQKSTTKNNNNDSQPRPPLLPPAPPPPPAVVVAAASTPAPEKPVEEKPAATPAEAETMDKPLNVSRQTSEEDDKGWTSGTDGEESLAGSSDGEDVIYEDTTDDEMEIEVVTTDEELELEEQQAGNGGHVPHDEVEEETLDDEVITTDDDDVHHGENDSHPLAPPRPPQPAPRGVSLPRPEEKMAEEEDDASSDWAPVPTEDMPFHYSKVEAVAQRLYSTDEAEGSDEALVSADGGGRSVMSGMSRDQSSGGGVPEAAPGDDSVSDAETWMMPPHNEDDSSWVNPKRGIRPKEREQIADDLYKKSVDLFPGKLQQPTNKTNPIPEYTPKHPDYMLSIHEEAKLEQHHRPPVISLGIHVDHSGRTGRSIAGRSIGDISELSSKAPYENNSVVAPYHQKQQQQEQKMNKDLDTWSMPGISEEKKYQLKPPKDGKDYRFSYIASTHTHSTANYSDVVRERYFPQEDNDYWGAPVRDQKPKPELPVHLTRSGKVKNGPRDENDSWTPRPGDVPRGTDPQEVYRKMTPMVQERSSVPIVSDDSGWIPNPRPKVPSNVKARSKRIDFTGTVTTATEGDSDESYGWNPPMEPSPPTSDNRIEIQRLRENDNEDGSEESEEGSYETDDENRAVIAGHAVQPMDAEGGNGSVVYSSTGRVSFQVNPQVIDDIQTDEQNSKDRTKLYNGMSKTAYHNRLRCFLAIVCLCVIPGAVLAVVFLVFDPLGKKESETSDSGPPTFPPVPTLPPAPTTAPVPSPPGSGAPVGPPTVFPSEDVLIALLSQVSPDGGAALKDPTSPQHKAMQWIRTSSNAGIYEDRIFLQRYALATLYYATNGERWTNSEGWMTDLSECDWYWSSSGTEPACDGRGNLLVLNLEENNLDGPIPADLSILYNYLQKLQLSKNRLVGSIPPSFGDFSVLRFLDLSENGLDGSLATELAGMGNLNQLILQINSIASSIPTEIGRMGGLVDVHLGANKLFGTIPTQVGNLSNLRSLSLYGNQDIVGTIPMELANVASLHYLYVDSTSLTTLPPEICEELTFTDFWADCAELLLGLKSSPCNCCTKCCDGEKLC